MKTNRERRKNFFMRIRRRLFIGANVGLALLLAMVVVFFVNALAWRLPHSWELDVRARHRLSEKTEVMLRGLEGKVEIIGIMDPDASLFADVRALLHEYVHAAQAIGGLQISLEWVNPDRDIARARRLADRYELQTGNQVIFRSGENYRVLHVGELARYEYELRESGLARRMVGFLGEQGFSSAILTVVSSSAPVVYFLVGHGERDIDDFNAERGLSSLARAISRDHFDVRRLPIAGESQIPDDCDVLVIAGARQQIADEVIRWISDYLMQRRGRVMLMLDAGEDTGLESLLERWQIHPGVGYVTGLQIPGWGLVVNTYGDHPITRPLRNVTTAFVAPRPLLSARRENNNGVMDEDQVRLTVLAGADADGWIQMDPTQYPPVFDADVDVRGPVPIAVAAELGPISPDAQLDTTRLVVIGDSHFVSNGAISSGVGGNVSFFMSALNWLADRDTLMAIEPSAPFTLQPGLTRQQWRTLSGIVIFALPGMVALLGGFVGYQRKR